MRKCPVHNCPAKTGRNIAIIVGSVMAIAAAAMVVLHFLCRCGEEKQ